jgi:hypothetical protein
MAPAEPTHNNPATRRGIVVSFLRRGLTTLHLTRWPTRRGEAALRNKAKSRCTHRGTTRAWIGSWDRQRRRSERTRVTVISMLVICLGLLDLPAQPLKLPEQFATAHSECAVILFAGGSDSCNCPLGYVQKPRGTQRCQSLVRLGSRRDRTSALLRVRRVSMPVPYLWPTIRGWRKRQLHR